jgi:hypothetical protein
MKIVLLMPPLEMPALISRGSYQILYSRTMLAVSMRPHLTARGGAPAFVLRDR